MILDNLCLCHDAKLHIRRVKESVVQLLTTTFDFKRGEMSVKRYSSLRVVGMRMLGMALQEFA